MRLIQLNIIKHWILTSYFIFKLHLMLEYHSLTCVQCNSPCCDNFPEWNFTVFSHLRSMNCFGALRKYGIIRPHTNALPRLAFCSGLGCLWALPDHSWRVPEDGGSEALGDAHQAGPIHLHDLVIHLDPDVHTSESSIQHFARVLLSSVYEWFWCVTLRSPSVCTCELKVIYRSYTVSLLKMTSLQK